MFSRPFLALATGTSAEVGLSLAIEMASKSPSGQLTIAIPAAEGWRSFAGCGDVGSDCVSFVMENDRRTASRLLAAATAAVPADLALTTYLLDGAEGWAKQVLGLVETERADVLVLCYPDLVRLLRPLGWASRCWVERRSRIPVLSVRPPAAAEPSLEPASFDTRALPI